MLQSHERYGVLPLKQILEPVIKQAVNGIVVSYDLSQAIGSAVQIKLDEESKKTYYENNAPIEQHSIIKRLDLAWTLNEIAKDGEQAFYSGSIAKKIIQAMQDNDGYITAEDLSNYEPRFSEPIQTSYRNHIIYAHPPPAGGASVLLEGLNTVSYTHLTLPTILLV